MAFKFGSNNVVTIESTGLSQYAADPGVPQAMLDTELSKRVRATLSGINVYGNLRYGSIGVGSRVGGVGEIAGWAYGGFFYNPSSPAPVLALSGTIRKFPFSSTTPSTAPQALTTLATGHYNTGWGTDSYAFYLRGTNTTPTTASPGAMYYMPYSSAGTAGPGTTSIGTITAGLYQVSGGGNGLQSMDMGFAIGGYKYPGTAVTDVNIFPFAKHEFNYASIATLTTSDAIATGVVNTDGFGFTVGGIVPATGLATSTIYKTPYSAIDARVSYGTITAGRYNVQACYSDTTGYSYGGRDPTPNSTSPATNNFEKFPFAGTVPVAATTLASVGIRYAGVSHSTPSAGFIEYGDNGAAVASTIINFPFASEVVATHYTAPGLTQRIGGAGSTSQ